MEGGSSPRPCLNGNAILSGAVSAGSDVGEEKGQSRRLTPYLGHATHLPVKDLSLYSF